MQMEKLEAVIGYTFRRKKLLEEALTHPSYDSVYCYERLEFLGDVVLDAIVGIYLFKRYPEADESFLTDLKSAYVNSHYLHNVGMILKIQEFVRCINQPPKLDNFVEAVIGAIYLDGGWKNAEAFIKRFILDREMKPISNYKNILFMVAKKCFNSEPVYILVKEEGPPHKKKYTFKVKIPGKKVVGNGIGSNKKDAEMIAAEQLLLKIKKHYPVVRDLLEK